MIIYRIAASAIMLISILFLPYWIYLPLLFLAVLVVPFFWEGIFFAVFIEAIYGSSSGVWSMISNPLTLSIFVLSVVVIPFRKRLRFYA